MIVAAAALPRTKPKNGPRFRGSEASDEQARHTRQNSIGLPTTSGSMPVARAAAAVARR
jgi:hypothetical protein